MKYRFFATLAAQEVKDYLENLPLKNEEEFKLVEDFLKAFQHIYMKIDAEYKEVSGHLFDDDGGFKPGCETEVDKIQMEFGEREAELKLPPELLSILPLSYKQRHMFKELL